jgi:hypothetical protein
LGLFIAALRVDYGYTRESKVEFTRENAKPRVIGGRKATGPANTFSSGIAGLPERVVKTGLPGRGGPVFFVLTHVHARTMLVLLSLFSGGGFAEAELVILRSVV